MLFVLYEESTAICRGLVGLCLVPKCPFIYAKLMFPKQYRAGRMANPFFGSLPTFDWRSINNAHADLVHTQVGGRVWGEG